MTSRQVVPGQKYIREPFDCEKCRIEHGVSPYHIGPDKNADCGRCMAVSSMKRSHVNPGCTIWLTADQNCWKSQAEHDTRVREEVLKPIADVYERFRHFDQIINDPDFIQDAKNESDYPRLLMYDMWVAIKKSLRRGDP